MYCSQPKSILLFITQTTEVRKQPMHVQHSHERNYSNKPQENHMYTGNFWLFEQATHRIYKLKKKNKR